MLKIASQPENINCLGSYLNQVMDQLDLHQSLYPNMLISLTEAVNNAIFHGNGCDNKKYVHVYLEKKPNMVAFKVCDEGAGFNPDTLPDPTTEENICKEGGRGVFLIKQLCDKVEFINNGSTVHMAFNTNC